MTPETSIHAVHRITVERTEYRDRQIKDFDTVKLSIHGADDVLYDLLLFTDPGGLPELDALPSETADDECHECGERVPLADWDGALLCATCAPLTPEDCAEQGAAWPYSVIE